MANEIPQAYERWTDGRGKTVKVEWCNLGVVAYRAIPTRLGQRTNHTQTSLDRFRKIFKPEKKS